MQVSVTPTEGLERRMTVEVPAEKLEQEVANRLKSLAGTVKMQGFRPGKVPLRVVQQRYGAQVRQEVEADAMRTALADALRQESLQPAGVPKLELGDRTNSGLQFTATFEVYPTVELKLPKGVTIERPVVEISDADLDAMIEKLRSQRSGWEAVDRASANGDQVIIDFVGKIGGEAFAGGDAADYPLVLGSKRFIAGFEDKLIGTKAGDALDVDLAFPEDYHNKEFAGKDVVFSVTVKAVNATKLPELDDADFLAALGVKDGGVEALRAEVRSSMEREVKHTVANKVKEQVLNALLAENEIALPSALVDTEVKQLAQQMRQNMGIQGQMQVTDEVRTALEPNARRRVALGLLLGEAIRDKGYQADAAKVRARIEELAGSYEDPASVINWYYEDRERLSGVEALVLEDQVVEWLMESVTVTDVTKTMDEVMEDRNAQ